MEKTIENKAKFFALYWGQNVRFWTLNGSDVLGKVGHTHMTKAILESCTLELKHLSSISDEDFLEVMCLIYPFQPRSSFKKGRIYTDHLNINQTDYLRSKGYALPWMGLSVEQLIGYGWIKLKSM